MNVLSDLLVSGRVALAPLWPDQVGPDYVGWLNDPDVTRFTEVRPGGHDIVNTRAYVQANVADPRAELLSILLDGRHVGNLRLSAIDRVHGRATVAIMVGDKAAWGQGVATAALDLAAGHAFSTLGLRKMTAGIYGSHGASLRTFEKAGFVREGVLRAHAIADGHPVDVILVARFAPGQEPHS